MKKRIEKLEALVNVQSSNKLQVIKNTRGKKLTAGTYLIKINDESGKVIKH